MLSLGGVFLRVKRYIEESGLEREKDKFLVSLFEYLDLVIFVVSGYFLYFGFIRNMSEKKNYFFCIR